MVENFGGEAHGGSLDSGPALTVHLPHWALSLPKKASDFSSLALPLPIQEAPASHGRRDEVLVTGLGAQSIPHLYPTE